MLSFFFISYCFPQVLRRISCGNAVLAKDGSHYTKAQVVRSALRAEFEAALEIYDAILLPTQTSRPWDLSDLEGGSAALIDQNEMMSNDLMTVGASLAGLPAISIPSNNGEKGADDFWVGMQIVGRHGQDDALLNMSQLLYDWKKEVVVV